MNLEEYNIMANVEEKHWWYQGLRGFLDVVFQKFSTHIGDAPRILDAGCGTGQNLLYAQEKLSPSYLGGFDFSEEALMFTKKKVTAADIYHGDIRNPDIHLEELDMIMSMDVISIVGFEESLDGLKKLVSALKPNGVFVFNLPAYQCLHSEHDIAVHTKERYTLSQVKKMMRKMGLEPVLASYRVSFVFPFILMALSPSLFRKQPKIEEAKSHLDIPYDVVNQLLLGTTQLENKMIQNGVNLPFGLSVSVVGLKTQ